MADVHDVAHYIVDWRAMSAMKLQKLVYYSQAWHLAEHGEALFPERIEAWANGPVVRELYDVHRGQYTVSRWPLGDPAHLSEDEKATIDRVLETYGAKDAQWLSDETHSERPWLRAREGVAPGVRSNERISVGEMRRFYISRLQDGRTPELAVERP